jgi:hypothetical protein
MGSTTQLVLSQCGLHPQRLGTMFCGPELFLMSLPDPSCKETGELSIFSQALCVGNNSGYC